MHHRCKLISGTTRITWVILSFPYRSEIPGLARHDEHLAQALSTTKGWAGKGRGLTGARMSPRTLHYWISTRKQQQ